MGGGVSRHQSMCVHVCGGGVMGAYADRGGPRSFARARVGQGWVCCLLLALLGVRRGSVCSQPGALHGLRQASLETVPCAQKRPTGVGTTAGRGLGVSAAGPRVTTTLGRVLA